MSDFQQKLRMEDAAGHQNIGYELVCKWVAKKYGTCPYTTRLDNKLVVTAPKDNDTYVRREGATAVQRTASVEVQRTASVETNV